MILPQTLPANFAKVDDLVYRGARPTMTQAERMVKQLDIKTVLNLEWEHDDVNLWPWQVKVVRIRDFEPLPFFWPALAAKHVVLALRAIIRSAPGVVYVHCRSGQNRTGVVIAAYRLVCQQAPLVAVMKEFKSYRGFWARFDVGFIKRISEARELFALALPEDSGRMFETLVEYMNIGGWKWLSATSAKSPVGRLQKAPWGCC